MRFKYINLSDIHLGRNNNPADNILFNLKEFLITNDKLIKTVDAIFITGDTFDKLLTTNSYEYNISMQYLTEFVLYCHSNNIIIRWLEGTPSHDWKQVKLLHDIIKKTGLDINFKYIDTLTIERLEPFGLDILYIPDEYKHKAKDTYKDVKKLMRDNKLDMVDLVMMHGAFKYQLPIDSESSHIESDYLDITRYYIHSGHIHTSSVYDRILVPGSFDRLAHGEEEKKGCFLVTITDNSKSYIFLENTRAMPFITIDCSGYSVEETIKKVKKVANKIKDGSISINLSDESAIKTLKMFVEDYPNIRFKTTTKNKNIKKTTDVLTITNHTDSFHITKENIISLINVEMLKHNLTLEDDNTLQKELNIILQSC